MSSDTKEVIVRTLLVLLEEKPLEKISVKDIVDHCGVNRNTFYYHFKDIRDVLEYALHHEMDRAIPKAQQPGTFLDALKSLIAYLLAHRKAFLHIYNSSMKGEAFTHFVRENALYLMEQYLAGSDAIRSLPLEKQELAAFVGRCFLEGVCIDWMETGMEDDLLQKVEELEIEFSEIFQKAFLHSF